MARDYFSHEEILAVVDENKPFEPFLLKWFGMEHITDNRKIDFDVLPISKRLAPFVSPRLQGKVMRTDGYKTNVYQPGYIKDKTSVDPDHVFTRRAGEPLMRPMSNAERYAATVVDNAVQQYDRWLRRLELMASQFLLNGTYTMTGEGISVEVDFGRNAANVITLAGNNLWGGTTGTPIDDLDNALSKSSKNTKAVVFGKTAWTHFAADPKFEKAIHLDLQSGGQSTIQFSPMQEDDNGVIYRGTLKSAGVELFTYNGTYTAADGNDTAYIGADDVLLLPSAEYGWRCFAAIWDDAANYSGMPLFYKNWSQEDPGTPFVMLQSAPMLAHTSIDSTVRIKTQG